mmetsp:Transcript_63464/g.147905  ORF Transcript_63464/g.147905 Transcript_63464/m.147905 type:complete len:335 (+) Transcript_63464:335-1339(+)
MQAHGPCGGHRLWEVCQKDANNECQKRALFGSVHEDPHDKALRHTIDEDSKPDHGCCLDPTALLVRREVASFLGRRGGLRVLHQIGQVFLGQQHALVGCHDVPLALLRHVLHLRKGHCNAATAGGLLVCERLGGLRCGCLLTMPAVLIKPTTKLGGTHCTLGRVERHCLLLATLCRETGSAGDESLSKPLILLTQLVNVAALHNQHRSPLQGSGRCLRSTAKHQVLSAQQAIGSDKLALARLAANTAHHLNAAQDNEVDGAESIDIVKEDVTGFKLRLPHEAHKPRYSAGRAAAEDLCLAQAVDGSHGHEVLQAPVGGKHLVQGPPGDPQHARL